MSVLDLVVRYEEAIREGNPISPETLCQDWPDLLPELQKQLKALSSCNAFLNTPHNDFGSKDQGGPASEGSRFVAGDEPVRGFKLICPIGKGGFGEVWKAKASGGIFVALKFIPLDLKALGLEVRAIKAIRNVKHPNLLPVFLAGRIKKKPYFVIGMELGDCTLWDLFNKVWNEKNIALPTDEVILYLKQAGAGIDYLNSKGIKHRDIKPQNILVVGGGVKVADFGLSKFSDRATGTHSGNLTCAYAPPESFNRKISSTSDQYSLAITYYQLRTGFLPFEGDAVQMIAGHLHQEPNLTRLPKNEQRAVCKALAKKPSERWPSCLEFVDSLEKETSVIMGILIHSPVIEQNGTDSVGQFNHPMGNERNSLKSRLIAFVIWLVILGFFAAFILIGINNHKKEKKVSPPAILAASPSAATPSSPPVRTIL